MKEYVFIVLPKYSITFSYKNQKLKELQSKIKFKSVIENSPIEFMKDQLWVSITSHGLVVAN